MVTADRSRTKNADLIRSPDTQAFVDAANQAANANIRSEAGGDVGRLGLTMLGVGAAARGATGLVGLLRNNLRGRGTRSGPAVMTLPYPVLADEEEQPAKKKVVAASDHGGYKDPRPDWDVGMSIAGGAGGAAGGTVGGGALGERVADRLYRLSRQGLMPGVRNKAPWPRALGRRLGGNYGALLGLLGGGAAGIGAGHLFGKAVDGPPVLKEGSSPGRDVFREVAFDKAAFDVTRKTAIPWYRPAMALAGIGGVAAGWKGIDAVLDRQRQASRERDVEEARQEFHDALLSQYDAPRKSSPLVVGGKAAQDKAAADREDCPSCGAMHERGDGTCNRCGKPWPEKSAADTDGICAGLGRVFDRLEKAAQVVKQGGRLGDLGGEATGLYGTYAALSGLATGALVYEQARKRQRRSILEKAMKRRERRRFYSSPPEIVALPEPVKGLPKPDLKAEMQTLAAPPTTDLVSNTIA